MSDRTTLQDHSVQRRIYLGRLFVSALVILVAMSLLLGRLVQLQIFDHQYYSTKSDSYRIRVQSVPPTRGLIYDRNEVLLAENVPAYSLTVVRENAGDVDQLLSRLTELITLSEDDVEKFRSRLQLRRVPFSSVLLRLDLSEEEIARIAVNQFRLPGVKVEAQLVRHYPLGETFSHSVGYLGSINEEELKRLDPVEYSGTNQIGRMGVERVYEALLHGSVGHETVEKNAREQIMRVLERRDPVPGEDIVLHLDTQLQKAAVKALGDYRGSIVALDPATGGILAMVSRPGFDPNLFARGISRADYARLNDPVATPLFNRALASYAPASTIKPFVGLAALDSGLRDREHSIHDPGHFRLPGSSRRRYDWTWRVSRDGHGEVDMLKAIYQSCNTYFWDLATDLGVEGFHDFLYRFGFGRNTSVDVAGGRNGLLPTADWKRETYGQPWYPGDTLNVVIGQGYMEATPLQLATAVMVLANKGIWRQPALLKRIGLDGEDIEHPSEIPDIELKDPANWDYMHDAMEKVVHKGQGGYRNTGSAYPYIAMNNPPPYRMAGKSGTAQVVGLSMDQDEDSLPEALRAQAFFVAFAPVEDPQIAISVFVEHGRGGSSVAGPIAREVIDAWLLREDADAEEQLQLSAVESAGNDE